MQNVSSQTPWMAQPSSSFRSSTMAAKKKEEKPMKKGDIKILIGAKGKPKAEEGVQIWNLKGEEQTKDGDRQAVAYITTQELYELGWIRRKH